MKICVAQVKAIKGDIAANIINHKKWIALAVTNQADMIIFPELSLTGYEPHLAKKLAMQVDDNRLDEFQRISDADNISIGVGAPIKNGNGVSISMFLFQPGKARQVYSKQYLHSDEEPFFVSGPNLTGIKVSGMNVSLAICYELSVAEHSATAFNDGAEIYIASAAKTEAGVEKSVKILSEIANKYSIPVLFSNCLGPSDDFVGAGRSAAWNREGLILGQLNSEDEGILIFDTEASETMVLQNLDAG